MGKIKWLGVFLLALIVLYLVGPKPKVPHLNSQIPNLRLGINQLETYVKNRESLVKNLKPKNEANIVWADSLKKTKTEYSVVYLHGFSASHEEGNALHRDFAKTFGCNLYLHRLKDHGVNDKEPLLNLTPESLVESAKEAVAIGKILGEKVIIISTSTGGTLSLYLASGNSDIAGLFLISPNIELKDPRSFILSQPWGLQIAKMVNGGDYYQYSGPAGIEQFWTTKYRIESLVSLKSLLDATMNKETFKKISCPAFVAYFPEDSEVSVQAIEKMFSELKSPEKQLVIYPEAGNHAIASKLLAKSTPMLKIEAYEFAVEVIGMNKAKF